MNVVTQTLPVAHMLCLQKVGLFQECQGILMPHMHHVHDSCIYLTGHFIVRHPQFLIFGDFLAACNMAPASQHQQQTQQNQIAGAYHSDTCSLSTGSRMHCVPVAAAAASAWQQGPGKHARGWLA